MKPYVTEEQVRAAKEVNTLAFLLRHQPERFKRVAVSYTHLDVYKRQAGRVSGGALGSAASAPAPAEATTGRAVSPQAKCG